MLTDKKIWRNKNTDNHRPDGNLKGETTAYFGYQKIHRDEKAEKVLKHFNSIAGKYDFMNTLLSFGIHYLWKRDAINMLSPKPGDRVLDVCGGTGDLSILAGRAVGPSGRVVLYDFNHAMIQAGRTKKTNSEDRRKLLYVQGDAQRISFPDRYFDAVMVGFGIRNVTHMNKGLKEMYRVLKPGGKIMCLEFSKPTAPLFRWLYDVYSFYVMPFIGEMMAGTRKAYTHLPESIRTFPLPEQLTSILENIGYAHVTHRRLTNGIAVVHLGKKI
jgi:demethylmenaquinone methyltransferase / 2-methoxy-6-polyprenyl-1,4-benzoquinol methylase